MPRKRNPENELLPKNCRFRYGSISYQVPNKYRCIVGKKEIVIGKTIPEAQAFLIELKSKHRLAAGKSPDVTLSSAAGLTIRQALALIRTSRSGATERNIEHRIDKYDVFAMANRAGGRCELSGIEWDHKTVVGNKRPFAPSIDRINCSVGYTFENCRLVCIAVNIALSNFGDETLIRIARGILSRQDSLAITQGGATAIGGGL